MHQLEFGEHDVQVAVERSPGVDDDDVRVAGLVEAPEEPRILLPSPSGTLRSMNCRSSAVG